MQRVYWIRHAESDHSVHNDALRPLTARGLEGRHRVEGYLAGRAVGAVLSSPYRRAYDTVQPFAASRGLQVLCDDRFRERRVAGEGEWIEDFSDFSPRQWADFSYHLPGGESLAQVEERMVAGLQDALAAHPGEDLVIGTHGTALCVLIHHFVPAFGLEQFAEMVEKLPWAVCMTFEEGRFSGWEVADISF